MIAAAPGRSVPTSIEPVVSTVIWTNSGMSEPTSARAILAALIAALICNGSWQVSTRMALAPPAISPRAWTRKESSRVW